VGQADDLLAVPHDEVRARSRDALRDRRRRRHDHRRAPGAPGVSAASQRSARRRAKGLLWKPAEAQEAIDFFPEVLCLPEETDADEDVEAADDVRPEQGTPFVLTPFQQFIIGSLFGWFAVRVSKTTGARREQQRFRIAYFEGAKGCGKTPMGAGILLLMLVRHGVRGAQLFCAAVTKEQAKIAFTDCVKMVAASPPLQSLITALGNNLSVKTTGSFIRPISAEKRGLDGKRVQGAVVDELHEHPSNIVTVKLRAGIKGRPNALIFIPTNSGFDRETVCWEYHDYSRQILEGTLVNEAWFAFVCHLDACDPCHAKGKLQPSDDCPDCDDWKTEGPHWRKRIRTSACRCRGSTCASRSARPWRCRRNATWFAG
jgi:phage terminase large subunit-like protein